MGGNRDTNQNPNQNPNHRSVYNVGRQEARTINNADTINISYRDPTPIESAEEFLRLGETSLHQGFYDSAVAQLTKCVGLVVPDPSAAAHARFLLALATLRGRRPSLCSGPELTSVISLLSPLSEPYARFLVALVEEDRTNAWMASSEVPVELRLSARQVDRLHADLIRRHVPAPQSRVWQALNERAGGTTS
ncbi:hypothetical protein [Streptomyces geranii]|uniref:hypothetical protein n=1 Tax=Streptomyces geranii TaxID=2058923 RepID=UPI000D03D5FE|nr:hypothetical protein [Streptomyces geranii]